MHVAISLHFGARFYQNILGNVEATQATMSALGALNRRLVTLGYDDEQINVTVFMRRAPGV
jgi:hypothetical protein